MSEQTSEHRHSHRRRRKHRRHRSLSKKAKWIIAVSSFVGLLVIAGLVSAASSAFNEMKKQSARLELNQYVGFSRKTVILMNPSEQDWGYTTVTINDQYVAHAPEIPKGMQFEIFLDQFQGTNGKFELTNRVDSVKIEPKGQKPILWTPGLE
jgi:hypothetical protein